MRKIYGIGETVYDIIFRNAQPRRAVPGGSTFNALISLGRCGLHPTMATETGDDHVGRLIVDFMQSNGVNTDYVTINEGSKTHISLAFLNDANDAQYQFYKDHAGARVAHNFPEFYADDVVIFGSFFAVNPVIRDYTREFLRRAHDAGCVLYYDVNFRAAHIGDLPHTLSNIEENMLLATIVRGSTEDFQCLYGQSDPALIYAEHIAPLCPNFICTAGGESIVAFFGGRRHDFDVSPISTVSTIGAGDNFNAGIVFDLMQQNIRLADLHHPTTPTVEAMIASGQRFSAEVCQSLDNYVTPEFASQQVLGALYHKKAFLFDLDGVIIDTEGQYQRFWGSIGQEFLPHIPDFATRIKGSTLVAIHKRYFPDEAIRAEVDRRLVAFEDEMRYELFPRVAEFLAKVRSLGIPCAIVTSSNQQKMQSLAQQQPKLTDLFDHVFTAEDAGRGKPYPDCYIKAAQHFGLAPEECAVFEDSVNGLMAAQASGALVVGLTTTHDASLVRSMAHLTVSALEALL